ncbi:MAG: type I methionyl aminopeptidase [Candidatus Bipolaricaulota bacterium]|nr:type I methionyl aminopeptidase [Candidatus Bipolaricaulota bacterium]MDW8126295.1 type I methionyl aminopeptidase [Candidatus Bipolaricaulota bacterium]
MIALKTERELEVLAENARILREILRELADHVGPGVTTGELDRRAERLIRLAGAIPAFKGYQGYPATLCTSVNEEIVHGIPSDKRVLEEGDLLSLDLGLWRGGYYADAAVTLAVGRLRPDAQKLVEATRAALRAAIEAVKIGAHVSDLSYAIESSARTFGFYPVREFVGHGIGRSLHEDPQIPNFGPPGFGAVLREGMILCPEPMLKGDPLPVRILSDGWTAVTGGATLAAHFEEMVAVTADGPWVLTGWIGEEIWGKRS